MAAFWCPKLPVDLPQDRVLEIHIDESVASPNNGVAPEQQSTLAALIEISRTFPDDPDTPTDLAGATRSLSAWNTQAPMIFADTGYFIAQIKPRDALHQRATAWANALHEPLLTTEFVLLEVADALSQPHDRAKLYALLSALRQGADCEIVLLSSALFAAGLQLHAARPDKEWSLTDCISFVVMREHNVTRALAYDHHFAQAGFEPLLRREPTP